MQSNSARQIAKATGKTRHQVKLELEKDQIARRKRLVRWALAVFVCISLALAGVIIGGYVNKSKGLMVVAASSFPPSTAKNLNKIVGELEAAREPDRWLMERHPVDLTFDHDYTVAKELTQEVNQAFVMHQSIPIVADMRREFGGHFYTSFLLGVGNGAVTQLLGRSKEELEKIERDLLRHEVAVYPRSLEDNPRLHGSHLVYDREWQALLVPAIDFPDPGWFDALVIHEMYHGWCLRRNPSAVKMAAMSDEWIREEIEAHNLENLVLDDSTGGRYGRKLQAIVSSSKSKSLDDFLSRLTTKDVRALDGMFASAGKLEGSVRTAQYFLSLAFAWINSKDGGKTSSKIAAYRAFVLRR